jgi:hypothetical protein
MLLRADAACRRRASLRIRVRVRSLAGDDTSMRLFVPPRMVWGALPAGHAFREAATHFLHVPVHRYPVPQYYLGGPGWTL